jgi:hypothetical protein
MKDNFDFKNEIPPPSYDSTLAPPVSSDRSSTHSASSALLTIGNFQPVTTLKIDARGISPYECAGSVDHNTVIFHEDGSTAYMSTRTSKYRGNVVLKDPQRGDLVTTSYSFGLKKNPKIEMLQTGKSLTISGKAFSRTMKVATQDGHSFEWSHEHTKDMEGKRVSVLALKDASSGNLIAQLVRGRSTRTEGTSRWSSGNGGLLLIGSEAQGRLEEELIVATCLMMLKYEVDRNSGSNVVVVTS